MCSTASDMFLIACWTFNISVDLIITFPLVVSLCSRVGLHVQSLYSFFKIITIFWVFQNKSAFSKIKALMNIYNTLKWALIFRLHSSHHPSPLSPAFQSTEPKPAPQQPESGLGTRLHSAPCLLECAGGGGVRQKVRKQHSDPVMTPQPLHPSPRISPLPTILGSPSRVS